MSDWYEDEEVPCQNAYCFGDGYAIWSGGAQKKGYDPPRQCSSCKAHNDAVTDVDVICEKCEYKFTIKAKSIVWHNRNEGEWEAPILCRQCEAHPELDLIELTCQNVSCKKNFVWTIGEQVFYASKGLESPELCKECREQRKGTKEFALTCTACDTKAKYSAAYIIRWRREEGEWDGKRDVCKLCFNDPDRAKRIRESKEEDEKNKREKKEEEQDDGSVGYYLRKDGSKDQQAHWRDIVDESHYVPSNVQSYEILTGEELYQRIVEISRRGKSQNACDHIMYGKSGDGHGWEGLSFDEVLSNAGSIAEDTGTGVIECRDSHTDYIIKYDTDSETLVIICSSEVESVKWRVKTTYQPSQLYAANKIRSYEWVLFR